MIKAKLHRPGYKKFKVSDLGINIIGNPVKRSNKPKEYTIMEMNPSTYEHDSHRTSIGSKKRNNILVFTQNISGIPYLCFSDGHTDSCIDMRFQIALSIQDRMIRRSGENASVALNGIANGGFVMHVDVDDLVQIRNDAEKYGLNLDRERAIKPGAGIENRMSAKEGIYTKYLISICM